MMKIFEETYQPMAEGYSQVDKEREQMKERERKAGFRKPKKKKTPKPEEQYKSVLDIHNQEKLVDFFDTYQRTKAKYQNKKKQNKMLLVMLDNSYMHLAGYQDLHSAAKEMHTNMQQQEQFKQPVSGNSKWFD